MNKTLNKFKAKFEYFSNERIQGFYERLHQGEVLSLQHVSFDSLDQYVVDLQRFETELKNGHFDIENPMVTYIITIGDSISGCITFSKSEEEFTTFCNWFKKQLECDGAIGSDYAEFIFEFNEVTEKEFGKIWDALEEEELV